MAAALGNKNAVGNNGGRPPYYDGSNQEDIDTVAKLCEEYFTYIQGEYEDVKKVADDGTEYIQQKTIRSSEPPTVTGLTLFLNFDAKSTLYEYAKKIEFSNPIKRALTKIEQFHEFMVSGGDKCVGNIFVLKNFGWRDNLDMTTNGKDLPSTPATITFKKYDGD